MLSHSFKRLPHGQLLYIYVHLCTCVFFNSKFFHLISSNWCQLSFQQFHTSTHTTDIHLMITCTVKFTVIYLYYTIFIHTYTVPRCTMYMFLICTHPHVQLPHSSIKRFNKVYHKVFQTFKIISQLFARAQLEGNFNDHHHAHVWEKCKHSCHNHHMSCVCVFVG